MNVLFILDFMYGISGTEGYPTLGAWKDAMVSRPGVAGYLADAEATADAHAIVHQVAASL